ncbi:uncharacterized protein LTR77_010819 [Saxophila tyrrhenica]|uniref:Uncharacterized protein n=1 Tax=Saxophila tyrrhenica TaxID=1690608 RepID=A0AAV9NUU7_9PEZI|nr:hypothetical protein LTR77_010819 [Saxophila tyrrhenica]
MAPTGSNPENGDPDGDIIAHMATGSGSLEMHDKTDNPATAIARTEKERAAREKHNDANCRLLGLCAELRNKIFFEVVEHRRQDYVESNGFHPSSPPLLQTCRGLRSETVPIFYGSNTIVLIIYPKRNNEDGRRKEAFAWTESLSNDALPQLRRVYLFSRLPCECNTPSRKFFLASLGVTSQGRGRLELEILMPSEYSLGSVEAGGHNCRLCYQDVQVAAAKARRDAEIVLRRMNLEEGSAAYRSALLELIKCVEV